MMYRYLRFNDTNILSSFQKNTLQLRGIFIIRHNNISTDPLSIYR
jgi:hypothetical protein